MSRAYTHTCIDVIRGISARLHVQPEGASWHRLPDHLTRGLLEVSRRNQQGPQEEERHGELEPSHLPGLLLPFPPASSAPLGFPWSALEIFGRRVTSQALICSGGCTFLPVHTLPGGRFQRVTHWGALPAGLLLNETHMTCESVGPRGGGEAGDAD